MEEPLTIEQTAKALGVGIDTLQRLIRRKLFPPGIPVSPGLIRWTAKDVKAYLHLYGRIGAFPPDAQQPAAEGPEENS